MPEHLSPTLISWASILEDATRDQALLAATMPFIHPHVALMPDAHLGKGATVGSVIPTVGAIMPAAVGVDIGCVDADSEYLAPDGWHRIADYTGGPVMQYDTTDGSGRFVEPAAYIVKAAEFFYSLRSKYGINQMLTPDHKVLCWPITGRARRRTMATLTASEFVARDRALKQGFKAEFATTFAPVLDTKLDLSDEQIRVQVMVSADGHIAGRRIVMHFKKARKIERARLLLTEASISYLDRPNADGTTTITFTPPALTKDLTAMWGASAAQLRVIADECLLWDGNAGDRAYFTRLRSHADFIQYVFTACGYRAVLRADEHYLDGKTDYRVFANTNTMVGIAGSDRPRIEEVPSVDGRAYCFTVPSGFWVMRRGGNVVMTGNCGMMAVRTGYTYRDLQDRKYRDPADLHHAISTAIPLSAGKYNQHIRMTAEARVTELEETEGAYQAEAIAPNWRMQLGSLGSGNHFIEVSLDEQENIWLFLHSGSRGVGNKLAMKWIKVAQEQCARRWITLPDRDLAYLVEGDNEFWDYMRALRWAQRFAYLNREEMMDRVAVCFSRWIDGPVHRVETVNCHHNYTSREKHWGKDVWLSRKGAIDASEGTPGLIPGSMGAASYVVTGRGNPLALNSSPHGAGRNYSRSAARKLFTRDDLDKRMDGITWGESDQFLDEHPDAYKPIDVVMADAADLVTVDHTLRQILNCKGA